jgi:hypothetical protein
MAPNLKAGIIEGDHPMSESTVSMSTVSEVKSTASGSKPTVSEAKRAANARNGQLGGPKTPEGKARSRMNGLVHGMRAETLVLLPGEPEEKFQRRLEGWFGELAPHGEIERYYAEAAVSASWRRDRCIRAETAVLTDRVRDAADPDPERAEAKARRLGARLAEDPAAVAYKLRTTSAGCRWMLAQWDDLDSTLDELGFWEHSRLHLALHLLGYAAPQWRDAGPVTEVLVAALSARNGKQTTAANVRFALGGKPEAMGKVEFENEVEALASICDDKATGRAELKAIVAEARADLEARLEWVEAVEARRRATAADRASFDDSAAGQRRQRYEAMHDRALRAALRDLRAEQERRMALGDVVGPTTAPTEPTTVEGGERDVEIGPEPDPIAPTEPTDAPTEPTEAPADAPTEPTEVMDRDAPSEPTAADPSGETSISGSISVDHEEAIVCPDRAGEESARGPIAAQTIADDAEEAGMPDPVCIVPVRIGADPTAEDGAMDGPSPS